jgi:hypothetical protein
MSDVAGRQLDEAEAEPRVFKIAKLGGRRGFVETLAKGVAAGTATVAVGSCGKGGGSPTAVTTTVQTTTTTAQQTWTLSGRVTDSSSGRPIAGATVRVLDGPNAGRNATTDADGNFSMANLSQSGFTITICADRYDCFSRGVTLTSTQQVEIRLTATTSTTSSTTTSSNTTSTSSPSSHYWWPC